MGAATLPDETVGHIRRKRGPAPLHLKPTARKKMEDVAVDLIARGLSAAKVARLHGISRRTVYRWSSLAASFDTPRGRALKQLLEATQPRAEAS